MKIQAVQDEARTIYPQAMKQGHGSDFGYVLVATQQAEGQATYNETREVRELSFKEMIALEHKAIVALRQGDLIGHERYVKELSGYHGALERVHAAAEIQAAANMNNGIFPEDAPQSVKSYVTGLSMKERMILFSQVAVQQIIANAYQDGYGQWRVRHTDESGYVDIFKQPDFSYTKLVEKMLAHIELNRKYINQEQHEEQLNVVLGLKEAAEGF